MASLSDNEVKEIHKAVYELVTARDYDNAAGLLHTLLEHNPNDAAALNFMGVMQLDGQKFHIAYQFLRRAVQENPTQAAAWSNFGLAAAEMGKNAEAMGAYLKSADIDNNYFKAYDNAAALLIGESRWDDAEKMCRLSLEISPEGKLANKNLAHVYLARHDWKNGWKHWELSLGNKYRKEWVYGDEKRWDGAKGRCVVVYGEQGLGDEISYASVIPDAIDDCKKVIIDCDPRLEKLFKRSFPRAAVHGTRRDETPDWLKDAKIDARCAVSSLPAFYRNADEDFPGTPYLKADPVMVAMFKAWFATLGKPVYGLCTHGGSKLTNETGRTIAPEQFSPLLGKDAIFVSLDYKGSVDNPRIINLPWATQCKDYDLTAALIASLDAVIGVNTTAMHCANGLGIPAHILVPEHHQWRYSGEYVWSRSAKLYRQQTGETWRDVIKRVEL